MHSDERRKAIADVLRAADAPISASALAEKFSVSRQIIVGDIALLRSSGEEILATPRGYVTPKEARGLRAHEGCAARAWAFIGGKRKLRVDNPATSDYSVMDTCQDTSSMTLFF